MIKNETGLVKYRMVVVAMFASLIGVVIISFMLGRYPIQPSELLGILFSKIFPIEPFWTERMETILFNVRLPRIVLSCLVGCSLAAAGAAYQGVFQNPMAAPDILGATHGASFGAALAIFLSLGSKMIAVFAFGFSLLTVGMVIFVSSKAKGKRILSLILSGIMIGSLFSAGTSFIKLVADPGDQLPAITYWLMGSLSGVKKSDILFAFVPMMVGLLPLFLLRWKINILTLGDDEAKTMGINVKWIRVVVILSSTLVTAASVSVSGMIGWVGLVIPHLARRIIGNNYRYLMPASMILGAVFLLIVDNVSRNLLAVEIPIGILTAFVGAPFFIYLITREGEKY